MLSFSPAHYTPIAGADYGHTVCSVGQGAHGLGEEQGHRAVQDLAGEGGFDPLAQRARKDQVRETGPAAEQPEEVPF